VRRRNGVKGLPGRGSLLSYEERGRYRVVIIRWCDERRERIADEVLVRTEPMTLFEAFRRRRREIEKLCGDGDLDVLTARIEDEGGRQF